jgi:squalene synthase HpnD
MNTGCTGSARTAPVEFEPQATSTGNDPRAHVRHVVLRSRTSFFWSMRLLPRPKRDAMFAIYAFCREVDDVADEPGPALSKRAQLEAWRAEIDDLFAGRPRRPTARALLEPVRRYDLPQREFHAVIEGMEMDAAGSMRAPSMAALEHYCRCVAGAVGLLSVRVFGASAPGRDHGAVALGEALQLTNILRDLAEDAARDRLYLPRELLVRHGLDGLEPVAVLGHPELPEICATLAGRARERFAEAGRWLAHEDRRKVRPAVIMLNLYRSQLERLVEGGWRDRGQPIRLGQRERLWIALRHGFL